MATNATEFPLNSSQPACSFLGNFSWREEYLTPTNFILITAAVTAEVVMIPFTVLFNALMISLVWRKRYLRKQKPCVLLACLAATDLLVGAVVLPSVVTGHVFRLSRATPCFVDTVTLETIHVACGASLCHLVLISGERYVAVKHSFRYETLVTTRRLLAAVGAAWAIPAAPTLGALMNAVLRKKTALAETILYGSSLLLVPVSLAMISFCQIAVFLETRRHRRHIRAHQVSEAVAQEMLKKDKAARTTTIVVGVVFLCYGPVALSDAVTFTAKFPMDAKFGAFFVTEIFLFANSLLNPIIYCMRTRDFKRALRELFGRENPAKRNAQAAGKPSTVVQRRISEAPRPSSEGKQQIAPSDRETVRRARSQSLDLSRDLANERIKRRKNSV